MAEKRALILKAARDAFLRQGYGGTSMESIAASAGVSIMTLYRHASSKDTLFEAVVSEACEPPESGEDTRYVRDHEAQPLVDVLTFIGIRIQSRLFDPDTLGLLRAVMIEHAHFPNLGRLAFEGLVASHMRRLAGYLATRPEADGVDEERRAGVSATFFDRLLGTDLLQALLGAAGRSVVEQKVCARKAAQALVAGLQPSEG